MKLVIDIDEDVYTRLFDSGIQDNEIATDDICEMARALRLGTPFPKGHRRLIFEPTKEEIAKTIGGQNDFAECIRDSVKAVFDNAPTIIEADKEDEE